MIRHHCDGCSRSFRLDVEIEPHVCEACSAVLCPLCSEDGCCMPVRLGDVECSSCTRGMVEVAGDCMKCGGLGCYIENGITRECRCCGGDGWLDVTLCGRCGGYGYIPVRSERRACLFEKKSCDAPDGGCPRGNSEIALCRAKG